MRHGLVDNPKNVFYGMEFPLSEAGRVQIAARVAQMQEAGFRPCSIVASPFLRTQETASIVASAFGFTEVKTDARLSEWNVTSWFNKPLEEFYAATGYAADPPPERLPEGVEPLAVLASRVLAVVHDVRVMCVGREVILVSHREPIVAALLVLQGESFDAIHRVACERGAVWKIMFEDSGEFRAAQVYA